MLLIQCALFPEAKPLIRALQLKAQTHLKPYPIYLGEGIALVISGVGKVNAAAATTAVYLHTKPTKAKGLLNVGIAGHKTAALGSVFLAEKIIDSGSGKSFYPGIIPNITSSSATVITEDRPQKKFNTPYLVDMESAGFFGIAQKLAPIDLIASVKVVSDNENTSLCFSKETVSQLIENSMESVLEITYALQREVEEYSKREALDLSFIETLQERIHFTETEKHRLINQVRSLSALQIPLPIETTATSAKELFALFDSWIENHPPEFS